MICKHCQHENPEGNRFCGMCGQPLLSAQRGPISAPMPGGGGAALGARRPSGPGTVPLPKVQPERTQTPEKKVQFPPVAPPPSSGPALQGTVPSSLLSPQTGLPGDAQVRVRVSPDPVPAPVETAAKEEPPPVSPVRLQPSASEATNTAKTNANGPKTVENKTYQQQTAAGPQVSKIVVPAESSATRPLYPQPIITRPPASSSSERTVTPPKPASESRSNPQPARAQAASASRSDSVRMSSGGSVPTSTARPQKAEARPPVRVSGPSFLGLGYDDVTDDRRGSDDLYKANWGGRIAVVFLVLALAGGLAYLQWRSVHPLQAASSGRSAASQPTASQAASTKPEAAPVTPSSSGSQTPAPQTDPAANSSASAQPGNGLSVDNKGGQQLGANTAGAGDDPDLSAKQPGNAPKPPAALGISPASQPQATVQSGAPLKLSAAKNAPTADAIREGHQAVTAKSADDLEEPVRLAETYLQGRGVPRNCNAALGILRSASDRGNPRAEIKLGALYATGNCVAPDRVAAYRLFSRAMQAQPNNTWLDQSRSVLWSDMSESERKQAMEVEK